ncbi:MAG TPA: hypothetical protein VHS78_10570 [Candidatus Elarobacter sp.]|jgi:hypothetical protein|nr:hypothetical protein [Candidatus Elarobacter sp.]
MLTRDFAAVLLIALLAGCGGGGGGASGQPVAPINAPFVPSTGTLSIGFAVASTASPPTATSGPVTSSARRAPRYVSPGTASVAIYDGATLIYVANVSSPANFTTVYANTATTIVTGATCTSSQPPSCTITVQTSLGAHTFGFVTYPVPQSSANTRTPPAFTGVILAEGELAVTVVAGANPAQTIAPLGVADQVFFSGPVLTQRLNGTGPLVGVIGTTYTIQYAVDDSAAVPNGYQIVLPGAYDNGPVTIAETDGGGIVTMTPVSQSSPPASPGMQSFTVTCAASGSATITASAKSRPNATYASGLTYSSANYPSATLGTTTLQCVSASGTLPITVN